MLYSHSSIHTLMVTPLSNTGANPEQPEAKQGSLSFIHIQYIYKYKKYICKCVCVYIVKFSHLCA